MFRIITELLNNTLKHSQAKNVNFEMVEIKEDAIHYISILIEDDGIGINRNNNTKGLGLSNIESRVQIMNGKIEFADNDGSRLQVRILIPVTV
ncbi:MAG: sensor histidine kinase [Cytophagales bacterium]